MRSLIGMAVVAFALLLVAAAEPVQGQGYVGSGCVGYGSFGQLGSPYALGRIPVPPYFALHPPVYYSQPVARTYGYSPFAYPGTTQTPEVKKVAAKVITNPHVTPAKAKATNVNLANKQVEIVNPFYNPSTKLVSVEK